MIIFSFFGFLWNSVFYTPVVNLIILIYKSLGSNLGIAIIVLTIIIRLLLWPFMKSQIMSQKKLQDLKPKLDALKGKYKNDKKKYQEEQLKLYKESGVNPAGSCLPLLIQIPFIYAVYAVIRTIATSHNEAVFNKIVYFHGLQLSSHLKFNMDFFGINLAKDAASIGLNHFSMVWPYLFLALLVGITQYFASKLTLPITTSEITEATEIIEEEDSKGQKGKKGKKGKQANNKLVAKNAPAKDKKSESLDPEAFSKALSTQMLYLFPLLLVWISLGFSGAIPAALSIYWVVQSLMLILQTLILQNKLPWMQKK